MIYLLLLAAATVAPAAVIEPPRLLNGAEILGPDDYPAESMRLNETGIVSVALQVSPKGRVERCEITETSGAARLDTHSCILFSRRARFDPARDAEGRPVASTYFTGASWSGDQPTITPILHRQLDVAALPAGYRMPVQAKLLFGGDGRAFSCSVTTSSGSEPADRTACTFARANLVLPSPRARSSRVNPVAVRSLRAEFVTIARAADR